MRDLIERAIAIIETDRECLFDSHQVGGVFVVEDEEDEIAADAIAYMDSWLADARAFLAARTKH